jgi:flavine halogenase
MPSILYYILFTLSTSTDESGWNWFIPLHNGTTSVSVVMKETSRTWRKEATKRANQNVAPTPKQHYLDCLQLSPGLIDHLGDAKLVEVGPRPVVQNASDFSYNAPTYSGDRYHLIGDAAGELPAIVNGYPIVTHFSLLSLTFIDQLLSSRVHLAFAGGLAASMCLQTVQIP